MVALRSQTIIYCVECLIITGLSTLLTDCGVHVAQFGVGFEHFRN